MANKLTVTYNGSNIINGVEISGNAAVTYNGSTIVTVTAGQTKTLNCSGKAMATNVVIGGKTLNCSGKYMQSNVVVKVESLVPPLAQATWAQISEISKSGQASQYWKIGDTKSVVLSGSTYTAQIVDFDHYDVVDASSYGRTKAGIVFQLKELTTSTYTYSKKDSEANTLIANNIECKDYIPQIKYPYLEKYNSTSVSTGQRYGILPSEQEVFGTTQYEKMAVGTQLAFYAAGNSKVKYLRGTSTVGKWWTRSAYNQLMHVCVTESGTVTYNNPSIYIAPLFCI